MIYKIARNRYKIKKGKIIIDNEQIFNITKTTIILKDKTLLLSTTKAIANAETINKSEVDQLLEKNVEKLTEVQKLEKEVEDLTIIISDFVGGAI